MTATPAAKNGLGALRQQAVLTQRELAAALGVHPRLISKWENGEARPRPANIRKLAEALGITPREVLAALGRPEEAES